jgi:PAS domain S-box-containing protein
VDHKIAFINDVACRMLGASSKEELIGLNPREFVHPDFRELMDERITRIAAGELLGITEKKIVCLDGSIREIEVNSRSFVFQGKRAIFAMFNDITYRKKAAEEKEKLRLQLFQARKMEAIGTLAGGIAHDFNNILAAILGYAEITLAKLPPGSNVEEDVGQVIKAAQRASVLVRQLLTFSRKSDQQSKPLRIDLLVKEALEMIRSFLPATIDIQADINQESGFVLADPTNIHQVVVNLCTNALHAMGKKPGKLEVKLDPVYLDKDWTDNHPGIDPGSFVRLMVKDNGRGMDEETVSRIYEPYFTTKEEGKGTGLGLSLIHGIVESCHGVIEVESVLGQGTAFHVYLPIFQEEIAMDRETENNCPLPGGDETILFVDDEPDLGSIARSVLSSLGYQVTVEIGSRNALATFQAAPGAFDLVITDQTMPGLTGVELSRTMLSQRPDQAIILCTGNNTVLLPEEVEAIGIKRVMVKPLSQRMLAETVRQVLDGTQAENQHDSLPGFHESIQ